METAYVVTWLRSARVKKRLLIVFLAFGIGNIALGAYIPAKALLAQYLLRDAWRRTLAGETAVKPWPWADTWPVARLRAPRQNIDLLVLAGANGASLAFGPGHLDGTPSPGAPGNSILGGHRDTSLSFLKDARKGDLFLIEKPDSQEITYRMTGSTVVDAKNHGVAPLSSAPC